MPKKKEEEEEEVEEVTDLDQAIETVKAEGQKLLRSLEELANRRPILRLGRLRDRIWRRLRIFE